MKKNAFLAGCALVGLMILSICCSGVDKVTAPSQQPNVQMQVTGGCLEGGSNSPLAPMYVVGAPYAAEGQWVLMNAPWDYGDNTILLPSHYKRGDLVAVDQEFAQSLLAHTGSTAVPYNCHFDVILTQVSHLRGGWGARGSCTTTSDLYPPEVSCMVHVGVAYP